MIGLYLIIYVCTVLVSFIVFFNKIDSSLRGHVLDGLVGRFSIAKANSGVNYHVTDTLLNLLVYDYNIK